MTRKRILFVDDETHILDALRNRLRKHRAEWEMTFAVSGQDALAELEKATFDVIVSDMLMPGMDGAALLHRVKAVYPTIARIVLSGHAEREAVVRALPVAHQYLAKPCDTDVLRSVIERTCNLQALLHEPAIREVVGKLDRLPSVPRVYWELTKAVNRDDFGLLQIARIVEEDPAMSAKVLQLVNSAYFGLAQRVVSIQQAVTYLGVELLRSLALTAHVFATMECVFVQGFSLDQLQRSSLMTARLAKRLVSEPVLADEAFAVSMVRDVGKLLLALSSSDRFAAVVRACRESGRPFHDVERELLGVTHSEVGAYLLGLWGLPFTMVEAVAYHHQPSLVPDGERSVLGAVHVADALIDLACAEECGQPAADLLDASFLESIGRSAELPAWREMARDEVRAISAAA
ncbi:MAG: response regulator [Acidobacteriota bacterium]